MVMVGKKKKKHGHAGDTRLQFYFRDTVATPVCKLRLSKSLKLKKCSERRTGGHQWTSTVSVLPIRD